MVPRKSGFQWPRQEKVIKLTKVSKIGLNNPSISSNIIAFSTYEGLVGKDLDGDGRISNNVVRYFDIASGTLHNTGGTIHKGGNPIASGNIIAFPTNEVDYKGDLNGDEDNFDIVLRYYDILNNKTVNTGAEMLYFGRDVSGSIILHSSSAPRVSLTNPQNNQIVLPRTTYL